MVKDKPPKTPYENQAEALEKLKKLVIPQLEGIPQVKEAVLWGSMADGTFGIYQKPFRGQQGSDVDLVVLLDEGADIPVEWRDLDVHKSWFDGYSPKPFRDFVYNGTTHKIDVLLVKPGEVRLAKQRLRGRNKRIYLKKGVQGSLI